MTTITAASIIDFWRSAGVQQWFGKSDAFDTEIRQRFEGAHHAAARGEFDGWAATPDGALGLLLLLDQFPRNLFRGSAHAYATDPKARAIAHGAIEAGHDRKVEPALQSFFYLPFEHSEDIDDQRRAVALTTDLRERTGDAESLKWAQLHLEIIERFGRFPHRNAALGRKPTPAEQAFLKGGGFAG
jgi:uncharacterized protein (DUF924 family)